MDNEKLFKEIEKINHNISTLIERIDNQNIKITTIKEEFNNKFIINDEKIKNTEDRLLVIERTIRFIYILTLIITPLLINFFIKILT